MSEEFNLSDKSEWVDDYQIGAKEDIHHAIRTEIFEIEDVKEFIRRLKEGCASFVSAGAIVSIVNKLAGKKLE